LRRFTDNTLLPDQAGFDSFLFVRQRLFGHQTFKSDGDRVPTGRRFLNPNRQVNGNPARRAIRVIDKPGTDDYNSSNSAQMKRCSAVQAGEHASNRTLCETLLAP
jgi:hypothetical protein